eukprot:CAMPEP_0185039768 /NCGR_PEP_ID=MMETSP1103-20130426/37016_1 /TAXON_ID=36769 /ORGANISM="Paraphysomonas bandaiensis, Strain Caron Lab Isolate" /LENGTH=375 /DNA_ID=CAMNT_0027578805 /DNA_START=87 /DNA_END=1214 /DNA_ORIENTATION=+
MTSWVHVNCFTIPKKVDPEEFFNNLEMDGVSDEQMDLLRETIMRPQDTLKRKAEGRGGSEAKKARGDALDDLSEAEQNVYAKYKAKTLDELKDYMRWNNQHITGTKTELVRRCVDGEINGALPPCPQPGCKGKLKLESIKGEKQVSCNGAFNDELGTFVRCYFKAPANTVERLTWRDHAKTEEEIAAEASFQPTIDTTRAAGLFDDLDMHSVNGKKAAVSRFVDMARDEGLNIPEADHEARVKLGTLLMNNPAASGQELLGMAEEMFGTVKAVAARTETSKTGTKCAANEGIVAALSELSEVYFKTGNSQAGNTYRKAAAAVRQHHEPITSGKAVSKGKMKIDGIGAKCGEMIDEFLEFGTIAKIQEKRAELSSA